MHGPRALGQLDTAAGVLQDRQQRLIAAGREQRRLARRPRPGERREQHHRAQRERLLDRGGDDPQGRSEEPCGCKRTSGMLRHSSSRDATPLDLNRHRLQTATPAGQSGCRGPAHPPAYTHPGMDEFRRATILPRDRAKRRPEWQKARVQSGSSANAASRRSAECSSTPRSASCSPGTAANTPADASTTAAPLSHATRIRSSSASLDTDILLLKETHWE